jgi:hypothetical protein
MTRRILRHRVRDLLRTNRLPPGDSYLRLRAGPASGRLCSCCDEAIRSGTEYGPEVRDSPGWRFHPRCHAIWKEERFNRGEADDDMAAGSASIRKYPPHPEKEAG